MRIIKKYCLVLVFAAFTGLEGCSTMSSESAQGNEKAIVSNIDDTTAEYHGEGQNSGTESKGNGEDRVGLSEAEIVNAAEFGNPKEVLDQMPIVSNVEVKKTGKDELQMEFELENVGLCTFAANKGAKSVLPDEVFVDATKVEWTAVTADGENIFPYMRVNEPGDMFMIDWTYNGYSFAIYGKSPQERSDRDMAGKIALAIIYNLSGGE